jgi:hypothetical protein
MTITGFFIRSVSSTDISKEQRDNIVYPTFDLVCKHAQMKVDSMYEKVICLIRANSEQKCIEHGYATLYSVVDKNGNENIDIVAYALYEDRERDSLST